MLPRLSTTVYAFLAMLNASFSVSAFAEPIKLELYTQEFPPLQVKVENQPEGYVVKFVEALIERASESVAMEIGAIHFVPWKRAIRTTQESDNVLFFSLSRTPNREEQFQWIGAVSPYEVAVYRHIEGPSVTPNTLSDLRNYSFAAQAGSSFEEVIKEEGFGNIIPVNYGKVAIKLLRAHRVDYAPLVTSSYYYRMEQYGFNPNEFIEVMRVNKLCKDLWLVTGNNTSPQVVDALRESFAQLKNEGVLEQLIARYQPDSEVMVKYRNAMSK